MTVSDLMVLAPWIVFAVGLAIIGVVLLRSHRASRPQRPPRPPRPFPEDRPQARRANSQETRCREKNAQARPH
jgi:hypothetical protein